LFMGSSLPFGDRFHHLSPFLLVSCLIQS
jgi:hypothetical protein